MQTLIGSFAEIVTLRGLSLYGALNDDQLEIIPDGGVLISTESPAHSKEKSSDHYYSTRNSDRMTTIVEVGNFNELHKKHPNVFVDAITEPMVLMPGFVDAHTHICFGGSRANDYAQRIAGKSYLEIAQSGGGILSTLKYTREAREIELANGLKKRAEIHRKNGVTTIEVKSGYGLSLDDELKMLRAIKNVNQHFDGELIPTCLAAHTKAPEFDSVEAYNAYVIEEILPKVRAEGLANRADIFVEQSAFGMDEAKKYLQAAKDLGFDLTVHADQFTAMGSTLAAEFGALSADHLEASTEKEIDLLAKAKVTGVLLPGASMGLGMHYPKGRLMLDKGMSVAIASDWNPGSAPMGELLMQAAVFGAYEKLSTAETYAALTFRAAHALNLHDRGIIETGKKADLIAFPTSSYKDILYYQGSMKPVRVW